jgi:diguanylate cyclase
MQVNTDVPRFPTSIQNLAILTFLLALILQIWSFLTLSGLTNSPLIEAFLRIAPYITSTIAVLVITAQHRKRGSSSLAGYLLAGVLGSQFIGGVLYYSLQNIFNISPFPSVADVFYTLSPILMIASFSALPHAVMKRLDGLRSMLDAGIIVMTISSFIWFFVLAPAVLAHLARSGKLGLEISLAMTYPIYDLVSLAFVITNISRWERSSLSTEIRWLLASLVGFLISDGYFLARCFIPALPETHPLEVGWAWGAFMIVVAARGSLYPPKFPHVEIRTNTLLVRYGAYIAILLIFPLLLFSQGFPYLQRIGVEIISGLVFLAVIARQIVLTLSLERSNSKLQKLSDELEARVVERTQELEFQALHDALTGLPNRVFAERHLKAALEDSGARATSVLYVDLDHFKDINDTLGHPIGDAVLCLVTERFQACTPPHGLLSRLGGDEFSLVLTDLDPATARAQSEQTAEQIVQSLSSALRVGDADFFLGASVGISFSPFHGDDATTLQKHADSAMYSAKRQGSGVRVYSSDLDASAIERLETERALRRALETDPGSAFALHYQPILDLPSGQIVALEALVRWNDGGVMRSPAQFIPIAEECGLIVPLGNWILHEACKQMVLWQEFKLRVSVNVSTVQFERPDFVDRLKTCLAQTQLEPERLSLELLESVLVSRFDETALKINQLRELGVRLALDDFGSGYSSLSYLNRLTFDTLKLDRSFINSLGSARDTRALVAAILSIASEFGMEAIAEGVETHAQLETLKSLGCDVVQGWLYAPALPASEVEVLLRNGALESREVSA